MTPDTIQDKTMTRADVRLYALLDPAQAHGHDLAALAARLAAGGATLLQLRDKAGDTRALVRQARAVLAAVPEGPPLLINDRVDVALASGAQGVHLGQADMEARDARRILGPEAIIGLTVRSDEEARAAPLEHADYVAIGGVFATASKDNETAPVGLDGLARIAAIVRGRAPAMTICAIAGIDAGSAGAVIGAGADGVAVIQALSAAGDPEGAARQLRAIVDGALDQRSRP